MTDNDIIKALECCLAKDLVNDRCEECPNFLMGAYCMDRMLKDALDLINRQKAEIERLEAEIDKQYEQAEADILGNISDGGTSCHWCMDEHRKMAIKEFAERLKNKFYDIEYQANTDRKTVRISELRDQVDWVLHTVAIEVIDNTAKEMTEEQK